MAARPRKPARKGACRAPGCASETWARGLCARHYQAEYRTRGPACEHRGCTRTGFAKGLCVRHYQEAYRHRGGPCRKRGCHNRAFSRGLCIMHYHRWYQKTLKAHGVASLKAVPERERA
jgi:hypothetical protein